MKFENCLNSIVCGDNREVTKDWHNESINCSISSPPYWGLRDYGIEPTIWDGDKNCEHKWDFAQGRKMGDGTHGIAPEYNENRKFNATSNFCSKCGAWRGCLGLEPTFELYIKHLCDIYDEAKRILRKDGTCWVNIADTYCGSGGAHTNNTNPGISKSFARGGAPRAKSCGTSDKELEDFPERDCFSESPCDVCRMAYQIGKSHSDDSLVPKQSLSLSLPNQENKEVVSDHSPTSDSSQQDSHSLNAIRESEHKQDPAIEPVPSFQESKPLLSSLPHQVETLQSDKAVSCLSKKDSSSGDVPQSEHKVGNNSCKPSTASTLGCHIYSNRNACPYLHSSISNRSRQVQNKSLCLIPQRFAIEMVNRGWILRNVIIWSKPNPMPSSAKDRFTVDFEYVFFFVKSQRYFFEPQYEECLTECNAERPRMGQGRETQYNQKRGEVGRYQRGEKSKKFGFRQDVSNPLGRNKRTTWIIPTQPTPDAHFATFPEDLVRPMVKAGCPRYVCKKCGKARVGVYKTESHYIKREKAYAPNSEPNKVDSTGWEPPTSIFKGYSDCGCGAGFRPGVVLDIFAGTSTVAKVAYLNRRDYIMIELSPKYVEMSKKRLKKEKENFGLLENNPCIKNND